MKVLGAPAKRVNAQNKESRRRRPAGAETGTHPRVRPRAREDRLHWPGLVVFVSSMFTAAFQCVLLFGAAGRWDLPQVWLFVALTLGWMAVNVVALAVRNPELLNHRGLRTKRGAKRWDRGLVVLFSLFGLFLPPIVMGLDVGRCQGSSLGPWATVLGAVLFSLGWIVITWAMLANTHFEVTVRIQTDRNHQVVSTGPYAIVRHPGYVGASLWALGAPLVVGSTYGLVPAGLTILVLVVRTRREDRTLQAELPGYADYAKKVKLRLLPGVW